MSRPIPLKKSHIRVLRALLQRARRREEIDEIARVSNGPEVIAQIRRLGLDVPCHRVLSFNSDGERIRFGVYTLSNQDRIAIPALLQA